MSDQAAKATATPPPPPPPKALSKPVKLPERIAGVEQVRSVRTPVCLQYDYIPGKAAQAYLEAFGEKRILGQRSPVDGAVFVPPRGIDPRYGVATTEYVDLPDRGHIGSFCVTQVPIPGRDDLELPYISAWIFLDGADVGFLGLVGECDTADCRIGMRVEAVWKDDSEIGKTAENIKWWRPTGEPDIPFEAAGGRGFAARQQASQSGQSKKSKTKKSKKKRP